MDGTRQNRAIVISFVYEIEPVQTAPRMWNRWFGAALGVTYVQTDYTPDIYFISFSLKNQPQ